MRKSSPYDSISKILPPSRIAHFVNNPVDFIEHYIMYSRSMKYGGKFFITDQQREIFDAVVNYDRVSVRAGRGIGKTAFLVWLTLWWESMFPNARVVVTSPSLPQILSTMWREISIWLKGSLLEPYYTKTARKLYLNENPDIQYAEPRTAAKEESMQGLHDEHMLLIIDEASGVDDRIWEVANGSLTGGHNKVILMTNPTRTSGFCYDTHHKDKPAWKTLSFSSEYSPIVDREWLDEMKRKYISGNFVHDMYKVHVMGEYPSGDPDAFIQLADVEAATWSKTKPEGPVEIGVDVARKGDDQTVICIRQGNYVFSGQELGLLDKSESPSLLSYGKTKTNETVDLVLKVVDKIREELGYHDIVRVKVDDSGLGGGVTDYLQLDREHNIEVIPCLFGGAGDLIYENEASKMWGTVKELIGSIRLPDDRFLKEELSTRRWEPSPKTGKIMIEPKKRFKKDFGKSPDRADALILAFADKENERKYIKGYDHAFNTELDISAEKLNLGRKFIGLFADRDSTLHAVVCSWFGGKLAVVDEYTGFINDVITVINAHNPYELIIGCKDMFNAKADDLSSQFYDHGIFISEPFSYNELGAIRQLDKLSRHNGLIVARECTKMQTQLRTWSIDKSKTELTRSHGLCYSLLLIVGELTEMHEIESTQELRRSYSTKDNIISDYDTVNTGFMSI